MSNYNTQLQSNNTDLQSLIDKANNLPDAGSGDDPFATNAPFTYTVDSISGASYGFAVNTDGYWESQNKGIDRSYAICRVHLDVKSACDITFDVINYAERSCDYALFGNLDNALMLSASADSGVKQNFKDQQSAFVVNVTYSNVSIGTHFIDIKFIKDGSLHSNNDSVQFKVQYDFSLPQETINKILEADEDLVPENIKSGVDIFGVVGNFSGDTDIEDALITRTISSYTNDRVTSIGSYAFNYCSRLTTVSFPAATSIGSYAFNYCSRLTTVSFPVATTIGSNAFYNCYSLTIVSFPVATTIGSNAFGYCSSLTTVSFPAATTIGISAFRDCTTLTTVSFPAATTIGSNAFNYCYSLTIVSFPVATTIGSNAFYYCSTLTTVSFPVATTIGGSAFRNCSRLTTASFPVATTIGSSAFYRCNTLISLYLTGSSMCTLSNSNALTSTPIGGYSASAGTYGSIYVPASLLASYQAATNWTYFSSRFVGV